MVFSSTVFLFLFLPVVLLLYAVAVRMRVRWLPNLVLLISSLVFYAWGEPVYISIMLFSTIFDYCSGRAIGYLQERDTTKKKSRWILLLSVCGNLGILFFFKYADFAIETFGAVSGVGITPLKLALPIGISFYTFQTMSYTIDVYRGKVQPQKNFLGFATYVCMFPQLIAGPIVRYSEVEGQILHRTHSAELAAKGADRFLVGLSKKVLLANVAGEIFQDLNGYTGGDQSVAIVWLAAIAYTFQIYFDFSGYSDMAIGLGQILGFSFPENFEHPYESKSITEFWRKWHITLGSWFREYVYIPMGGNRKGWSRQMVNLAVVWFLTGFWHGAGWNFILWGLYYFVLLLLEKTLGERILQKVPAVCSHLVTLFLVNFGWVIFAHTDMVELGQTIANLFGFGNLPFFNAQALYEWKQYILFLLILAIGSTTLPKRLAQKVPKTLLRVGGIVLLVFDIAFLVSGSYNPFLYFRF